jgi:hypothetical protein
MTDPKLINQNLRNNNQNLRVSLICSNLVINKDYQVSLSLWINSDHTLNHLINNHNSSRESGLANNQVIKKTKTIKRYLMNQYQMNSSVSQEVSLEIIASQLIIPVMVVTRVSHLRSITLLIITQQLTRWLLMCKWIITIMQLLTRIYLCSLINVPSHHTLNPSNRHTSLASQVIKNQVVARAAIMEIRMKVWIVKTRQAK